MKGLPLLILPLVASLPSALQNPPKGVIISQPGYASLRDPLKASSAERALLTFSTASVIVEDIPDALKADLSQDAVFEWTSNLLKNAGIKVVSVEDQLKAFTAAGREDDLLTLMAHDQLSSEVYVNINAVKATIGPTAYNASLHVKRGAFIHPGYFILGASVWDREVIGVSGSGLNAKDEIKRTVTNLMKMLETDILKARAAKK